jgi:hypothetical protein
MASLLSTARLFPWVGMETMLTFGMRVLLFSFMIQFAEAIATILFPMRHLLNMSYDMCMLFCRGCFLLMQRRDIRVGEAASIVGIRPLKRLALKRLQKFDTI